MMKRFLIFIFILFIFLAGINFVKAAQKPTTIYFFYNSGCSHCTAEKPFLASLAAKYSQLTVKSYEVWANPDNVELFDNFAKAYSITSNSVPATFIGDSVVVGYSTDEVSGKEIEEKIKYCLDNGCIDPVAKLESEIQEEENPPIGIMPLPELIKITPPSTTQPIPVQVEIEPNLQYEAGMTTTQPVIAVPAIKMEVSPIKIEVGEIKLYKYTPSVPAILAPTESQKEEVPEFKIETKLPLVIEEDKLVIKDVETSQTVEVGVKPEQVVSTVQISDKIEVKKISLALEEEKPVYNLELKQKVKLLGFIPIQVKTEVKISGESGQVLAEKKPWWTFLVTGLNKFIKV